MTLILKKLCFQKKMLNYRLLLAINVLQFKHFLLKYVEGSHVQSVEKNSGKKTEVMSLLNF